MTTMSVHASPLVPAPAPDTHPWRDRVMIALFALALAVPMIGTLFNYDIEVTAFENRRTAPWPYVARNLAELRTLPSQFEAAFADRFGGRDVLIALHHFVKLMVFDAAPVPNVMVGRDGWLYFLGEDGKSIDRDYRGIVPYSPEEPFAVAAELKRRHDYLASRGIAYVVMIVPDKATIYPEYLPFWVARGPGGTRLDLLYAALKAYPEIMVLDLRAALMAAKARDRVYFKTDSHWNYLGAEVGYRELAAQLKSRVPSFPAVPPPPRPPYDPDQDFYSGDLARLVGLPLWVDEDDIAPFTKVLADASTRCAQKSDEPLPPDYPQTASDIVVYVCDRAGLPTALVYRDSMGDQLIPLLAQNFRRSVYVTDRRLDRALVEREKPDVVIEEMVERTIHAPAALPMN
jgi:hypothetical protein